MAKEDKNNQPSGSSDSLEKTELIQPETPKPEPEGLAQSPTSNETELSDAAVTKKAPARRVFSPLGRLLSFKHLYLLVFVLLMLLASAGVFTAVQLTKDEEPKTPRSQSLTDQQLAELKGSTTVVGDSQSVLDIQSNAVFEGQVLVRNNLDVAGTIKIGGPLSLSGVSVGGTSTFNQVDINDALTVAGNATFKKNLTVAGTGSFSGALSAGALTVTTINLAGDLTVSRHIAGGGGVPSRSNGSALGGGGTSSVSGTDTAGTVTINTGGSPPAGCFITVNFTRAFNSTPHVVISPSNSSSASLNYYTNRSAGSFSVCTVNAPSTSTTYLFDYVVFD